MFDQINWRVVWTFALAILIAAWGSAAAALLNHEGDGLSLKQFLGLVFGKVFIGAFSGCLAALLAHTLKWGFYEGCLLAGIAGYAGKEFLDWIKDRVKGHAQGKGG